MLLLVVMGLLLLSFFVVVFLVLFYLLSFLFCRGGEVGEKGMVGAGGGGGGGCTLSFDFVLQLLQSTAELKRWNSVKNNRPAQRPNNTYAVWLP